MKKSNVLAYSISASFLIVALSVAYYFIFYIPKQNDLKIRREEDKIEQEKKDAEKVKLNKELDYHGCLARASGSYTSWWNDSCKGRGLEDDCRLPSYEADTINESLQKEKDRCLKIYQDSQ